MMIKADTRLEGVRGMETLTCKQKQRQEHLKTTNTEWATLASPIRRTFTGVTGRDPLPPRKVFREVNARALQGTEPCIARAPPYSTIWNIRNYFGFWESVGNGTVGIGDIHGVNFDTVIVGRVLLSCRCGSVAG